MLKVLECKRDEGMKPFDPDTAQQLATELYNAGGGRNLGVYVGVYVRTCVRTYVRECMYARVYVLYWFIYKGSHLWPHDLHIQYPLKINYHTDIWYCTFISLVTSWLTFVNSYQIRNRYGTRTVYTDYKQN